MSVRTATADEAYRFVQDRLDSGEWWLIPVCDLAGVAVIDGLARRFFAGDNAVLLDLVAVPRPTQDVALLTLVLASKSCLTPARLAEHFGVPEPEPGRDILAPGSTPLSVVVWLNEHFR